MKTLDSELARLAKDLERFRRRRQDPLAHIERVPSPVELFEAVIGSEPDEWQRHYLENALNEPRVGIAASRQTGKSTATAIIGAWCLLFMPGFQWLVASRSLRQAAHYLTIVRHAILAVVARESMLQLNRLSMELPHGSQVISIPCAQPDAGRGFSPDLVVLDEAAFAPDALFRAITPSLAATHGALHMLSSPNGRQGYFFEAFEGAAQDVFWKQRVKWQECPRIDPAMIAMEKVALGEVYFRQEYEAEFIIPEGAFFALSAITNLEEQEDPDLGGLTLKDMEAVLQTIMPVPKPNADDLRVAFDRADRVQRLIYD
jgi:hypothetical protein